MRGQVQPNSSMPAWAASLMALRRTVSHEPPEPIADAVAEARRSGTCLVGDVTNTFATFEPLLDSELSAMLFRELLGFSVADPGSLLAEVAAQIADLTPIAWLRTSIVPHAPYSVSPALLQAIAGWSRGKPLSIHLGESAQEIQFLRGRERGMARAAGVARSVECVVGAARMRAGRVPGAARLGGREPAGRPRRAFHRRRSLASGVGAIDGGRLPAQQPLDGGRGAADRTVLCVGCPRRGRDRQPRERRGSECVCGTGGSPAPGAEGSRGPHPRKRHFERCSGAGFR